MLTVLDKYRAKPNWLDDDQVDHHATARNYHRIPGCALAMLPSAQMVLRVGVIHTQVNDRKRRIPAGGGSPLNHVWQDTEYQVVAMVNLISYKTA